MKGLGKGQKREEKKEGNIFSAFKRTKLNKGEAKEKHK